MPNHESFAWGGGGERERFEQIKGFILHGNLAGFHVPASRHN